MKTPEMVKSWFSNPHEISEFDAAKKRETLKYIEQLEELIMCMKIQMRGDCGVCKHRHNSKKRKDGPSFIGLCWTCVHDESRPNWEYEGLPELPKKGES